MIPALNIVAWGATVPWAELRQVEQDLIISRAIVEVFRESFLHRELRFRGGTALNKLHFPAPLRYSEDIDFVRTTAGPIGPILDRIRSVLEPWLGHASFDQSPIAPKLRFRVPAEDDPTAQIRLKIEINTTEIEAYDTPVEIPFGVDNPWFSGTANVATFSREEMLATKLRALLQRDKGRDLFDITHALTVFGDFNVSRVTECFGLYLNHSGLRISRAQAEKRMFTKLRKSSFMNDVRPLVSATEATKLTDTTIKAAFMLVFTSLIERLPGEPWTRTAEMVERFSLQQK